ARIVDRARHGDRFDWFHRHHDVADFGADADGETLRLSDLERAWEEQRRVAVAVVGVAEADRAHVSPCGLQVVLTRRHAEDPELAAGVAAGRTARDRETARGVDGSESPPRARTATTRADGPER